MNDRESLLLDVLREEVEEHGEVRLKARTLHLRALRVAQDREADGGEEHYVPSARWIGRYLHQNRDLGPVSVEKGEDPGLGGRYWTFRLDADAEGLGALGPAEDGEEVA